jgi:hypothetical protein
MSEYNYPEVLKEIHDDIIGLTNHVNLNYVAPIVKTNDIKEEPKTFLYTVLYKVCNGLSSCQLFLINSENADRHLDGLFLILRTLMSDSIITHYVIRKEYTGDDNIVNNIRPLYTEHLKYGLSDLRKYGSKFWNYTEVQIGKEVNKMINNFNDYLNKDGSFKYKPEISSMGDKALYLVNNIPDEAVKLLIIKAHNLYMFFSKYEHLGILSLSLIHRQYDKKNKLSILRQVVEAIFVVGHTIELCIRIWKQFEVEKDTVMQSYIERFSKQREKLILLELNL